MARLDSVEQLVEAWSDVASTRDPRAALTAAGHVIAPSIAARLENETPRRRFTPQHRAALLKDLRGRHSPLAGTTVRFAVRRNPPVTARALPAGQFDVVVSVRLEVAADVLGGLYATRVIPHRFPPGAVPLALAQLRALSDDVPDAEGVTIGALHLTAAPTVQVGPGGAIRLGQALRLDVDIVRDPVPRRTTVAMLTGVLFYDARPSARDTDAGEVRIELDVHPTGGQGTEEFVIDPDSTIQARDTASLAAFTSLVVLGIRAALQDVSPVTICPDLRLPFDRSVPVRILAVEIGTASTARGSGALHVGVLVGFGEDAVAGQVPAGVVLSSDPLGDSSANVVVSVHEATLQAAAEASIDRLESRLNAKLPGFTAVVDSATVTLRSPDTIRLSSSAHIEDFCGPGPFNFINLDFELVMELEVSVFDGTIHLEGDPEVDFSNGDIAVCLINSLADAALLQFADLFFVGVALPIGIIIAHNADALDEKSIDLGGVLDPHVPVPGTELAPRAEVMQVGVTDERVELRGVLSLEPDTEHIFAYVKVRQGVSPVVIGGPVVGARVRVMDQDAPAPPGDDFAPPALETPVILRGQTTTIRLDLRVDRPTRDEVAGTGTTDRDGLARIILNRNTAGGSGGTLVTEKMTTFTTVEKDPVRETFRTPLREELADAYLHVRTPDGREFDSRRPGGMGLLVDLEADHIGTAAAPIVITLPMPDQDTVVT